MANTRKPISPALTQAKNPTLAYITAKATPNERVVSLCVAGALFAEHQRLDADLQDAQTAEVNSAGARKLNEIPVTKKIALAIQELEARMRTETYEFTFRQVPRVTWRELMAEHPSQHPTTERVNLDTFSGPAVALCCVQPEGFDNAEVFDAFWDSLSSGQQGLLFGAAWEVNEGGVSVPFSVNASVTLSTSIPN